MRISFLFIGGVFVLSLLLATGCAYPQAAPPAKTQVAKTLQAELTRSLEASKAKVGDVVTAETVTPLELDSMKVPLRTKVIGHVLTAEPNRLVLVFDQIVIKKDQSIPLKFSLRAVMMPQPAASLGDQMSPSALGGGGRYPGSAATNAGNRERSPTDMTADSVYMPQAGAETRSGSVVGLPGVELIVSDDPKTGTTLQTTGRKLSLEKGLQMMFLVSR